VCRASLPPFETEYKHVLSYYINPHPLHNRSDSAPYPTSKKIRIRNRIRVISAPLYIRQKNMNANVVKVLSDPIRSAFIPIANAVPRPKPQPATGSSGRLNSSAVSYHHQVAHTWSSISLLRRCIGKTLPSQH
jgi:hypothetical protein